MEVLNRLTVLCLSVIWCIALMFASCHSNATTFETLTSLASEFELPEKPSSVRVDVDGDGLLDVVAAVNVYGGSALLVLGGSSHDVFASKQVVLLPTYTEVKAVLASETPSGTKVVVVAWNGDVYRLDGWPLTARLSFSVGAWVFSAAAGDVDADGSVELITSADNEVRTYDLDTGALKRSTQVGSNFNWMLLAQLDADPATEILGIGSSSAIIDGATNAVEWTQSGGFALPAIGKLGIDDSDHLLRLTGSTTFGVFQAPPWSPLWSGVATAGRSIGALSSARLHAAERDAVLVGENGLGGGVQIFDAMTQQLRQRIPGPSINSSAVSFVTGVDLDGDEIGEVVFGSGTSVNAAINAADVQSGSILQSHYSTTAPLLTTAIGDVDGDGRLELVAATFASNGVRGTVLIADLETGREEWRGEGAYSMPLHQFNVVCDRILLVPRAGVGMDIILSGHSSNGGRIVRIDGVSKQVSLDINHQQLPGLAARYIRDIALFDHDLDGVQDFVIGTSSMSSATQGALLHVISGRTGAELWRSVAMGSDSERVTSVFVMDRDTRSAQLVVGLAGSLRAYDARTGLLSWTWSIQNDGVSLVPNEETGDELFVFRSSGEVVVHAAGDRTFRRGFALSSPLNALEPLQGRPQMLVAHHGNRLALVDGENGNTQAVTTTMGPSPDRGSAPAVQRIGASEWYVAAAAGAAIHRFRLVLDDRIFSGSFDAAH